MKNLLLIPLSFPYDIGGENTFLKSEVPLYPRSFYNVTILPCKKSFTKIGLNPEIKVDLSLAYYNEAKDKPSIISLENITLFSLFFFEFLRNVKKVTKYKGIKKLISNYRLVCKYYRFFNGYFENKKKEEWIIYTYWFTPITTAAVLYAAKNKNIKVVTRAHGIDLYEYRNNNYIPFRRKTIELLTKYFFVSETGRKYTEQLYPEFKNKYLVFGLGVEDTHIRTKKSKNGTLSIVSCSSIDNNKRVHLILEGIGKLATENGNCKIIWNHFGAGPLLEQTINLAKEKLAKNVEYNIHGQISNDKILKFYENSTVDIFITTSASEGRPISIMEALCCTIPVIATNVGGIPEIINNDNGILINANPEVEEITKSFQWFIENDLLVESKKTAARATWEQDCNALKNFTSFVDYFSKL